MDGKAARSILERASNGCIAVVGDLMLDRYVWGQATRISQEAPVPVVAVKRRNVAPGGAANVARNLVGLGACAAVFGVVGDDASGRELTSDLEKDGCISEGLVISDQRTTTEKTRVLAGNQQVVRIDTEVAEPLSEAEEGRLLESLQNGAAEGRFRGIIVEDYAKGVVTARLLAEAARIAAANDLPIALDPHPSHPYRVAGLTVMTPNRAETFALAGNYDPGPASEPIPHALDAAAHAIARDWGPNMLLVTLGEHGMALFRGTSPPHHIPTRAREVFDVSGAGDTVITSFTLALCSGATPEEACDFANHAAGVVVGKVGTAPVYRDELVRACDAPPDGRPRQA